MLQDIMPEISLPVCPAEDWRKAVWTLDQCRIPEPVSGCVKPSYSPGGRYGYLWWSLDYALAMEGIKWLDFSHAEEFIENLCAVQDTDGRVPLYGKVNLAHGGPIGSLPKFLDTAFDVAIMSGSRQLQQKTADLFARNIAWWCSARQDPDTGLISAVYEETFIPNTESYAFVYAPMDTNIQIVKGCRNGAVLAEKCGDKALAEDLFRKAGIIVQAVEKLLWNEERGCYLPYDIRKHEQVNLLMGSTFLGFYLCDRGRHARLRSLLLDPEEFHWTMRPLTSVSRRDPAFQIVTGKYCGNPAWSGSVWALINDASVKALNAAGLRSESAELVDQTLSAFRGNYAEFLQPFTGSGEGVKDYAWTAGLFIREIIEEIFGLSWSPEQGLKADPNLPESLRTDRIALEGLHLPDGKTGRITIENGSVTELAAE